MALNLRFYDLDPGMVHLIVIVTVSLDNLCKSVLSKWAENLAIH